MNDNLLLNLCTDFAVGELETVVTGPTSDFQGGRSADTIVSNPMTDDF